MKYFRLHTFCRFIKNDRQGCIYDLSSGNMWSVEDKNINLLDEAEHNLPIQENEFFDMLCKESLGNYYERPVWIDNGKFDFNGKATDIIGRKSCLTTLFIVFNKCSLSCSFCDPYLNRQTGCKIHDTSELLKLQDFRKIIDEAIQLGCEEVIYIGGDPLMYRELLCGLIKQNSLKMKKQQVFTNGALLNSTWYELFRDNHVRVNYQIASPPVAFENEIELYVERLLKNSELYKIDSDLTLLLNNHNENNMAKIIELCAKYNINCIIDPLIAPIEYRTKKWQLFLGKGNVFQNPINQYTYEVIGSQNTCLYGKIALRLDGTVIPCPMMDGYILGNLLKDNLYRILKQDAYRNIIYLSKEKQEKCTDCVYRYGCRDCRAIEYNLTGVIKANTLCNRL